jgi:hypothetical protein
MDVRDAQCRGIPPVRGECSEIFDVQVLDEHLASAVSRVAFMRSSLAFTRTAIAKPSRIACFSAAAGSLVPGAARLPREAAPERYRLSQDAATASA